MKFRNFITTGLLAISLNIWSQQIITLQPGAVEGKDSRVSSIFTENAGDWPEFAVTAWTWKGRFGIIRELIDFDLSAINPGAIVEKAQLFLYAPESSSTGPHSTQSGSNSMYVRRVTSPWNEHTVTWASQPSTTTYHQVITPASSDPYQNYVINVTNLVQDMIKYPATGHGFMFRLVTEEMYRMVNFASSDHPDTSLHPKLVITLAGEVNMKPGAKEGKDSRVSSIFTENAGDWPEFAVTAWTWKGRFGIIRELIEFNTASIKPGTVIERATLKLYAPATSSTGPHSTQSGSNSMYVRRVTSPWNEYAVTWASQPSTTTYHQVVTPASSDPYQDYSINVTALVQDMVNNPSTSHGFMFRLVTEERYRMVNFASSDHPDSSLHPELELYIRPSSRLNSKKVNSELAKNIKPNNFTVYPNPTNGILHIKNSGNEPYFAQILHVNSTVLHRTMLNEESCRIDMNRFGSSGIYIIQIFNKAGDIIVVEKVLVK